MNFFFSWKLCFLLFFFALSVFALFFALVVQRISTELLYIVTVSSISEDGKTVMYGGGGHSNNERLGWLFIRDIETGKKLFGFIGRSTVLF